MLWTLCSSTETIVSCLFYCSVFPKKKNLNLHYSNCMQSVILIYVTVYVECLFLMTWMMVYVFQLLQSFKIMDYSLLVGIHNVDQASRERFGTGESCRPVEGTVTPDQKRPQAQKALYSTAMESIQGEASLKGTMDSEDQSVTHFLTISVSVHLILYLCLLHQIVLAVLKRVFCILSIYHLLYIIKHFIIKWPVVCSQSSAPLLPKQKKIFIRVLYVFFRVQIFLYLKRLAIHFSSN